MPGRGARDQSQFDKADSDARRRSKQVQATRAAEAAALTVTDPHRDPPPPKAAFSSISEVTAARDAKRAEDARRIKVAAAGGGADGNADELGDATAGGGTGAASARRARRKKRSVAAEAAAAASAHLGPAERRLAIWTADATAEEIEARAAAKEREVRSGGIGLGDAAAYVIGSKGATINRLRQQFHVEIDVEKLGPFKKDVAYVFAHSRNAVADANNVQRCKTYIKSMVARVEEMDADKLAAGSQGGGLKTADPSMAGAPATE